MKAIPTLPPEKMKELKEQFDELLRSTKREGIEELILWLENETDFYTAPASASNHGAFEGGLLMHSVAVYKYLQNFIKPVKDSVASESIIISALLHDICKVNFYAKRIRNVKKPGEKKWEEEESFIIDDQFPLGHGEKSMFLANKFIKLTDDEALAIRWHMGGFDDAARQYAGGRTLSNAFDKSKLTVALAVADMYVAQIIESQIINLE